MPKSLLHDKLQMMLHEQACVTQCNRYVTVYMVFIYYIHTAPRFSYKSMRVFSSLSVRDISHYRDLRSVTSRKVKVSDFNSASVDSEGFVLSVHYGTCVHNNYIIIIYHFYVIIYPCHALFIQPIPFCYVHRCT